jgi:hypothetical protein
MLAKDIPQHIEKQVEDGFRISNREATQTLHHYIGTVQGAKLLDSKSIAELDRIGRRFASASDPKEFFIAEVQPFLRSLTPQRRG